MAILCIAATAASPYDQSFEEHAHSPNPPSPHIPCASFHRCVSSPNLTMLALAMQSELLLVRRVVARSVVLLLHETVLVHRIGLAAEY
jgi:hypothetical protein